MIRISAILLLMLLNSGLRAFEVKEFVATEVNGFNIPIKVCIPDHSVGKRPVIFFVHGGGWNGGTTTEVPDAQIPSDAEFICDQMGVIYVGLAYRCKGNKGTFQQAIEDLDASIAWFTKRADEFNADMSQIGFSGASAGTTLSAGLAQKYAACKLYIGCEGMYNIVDQDTSLSHFPSAKARADYGLSNGAQKMLASPYHNLREHPASALLLHGRDDWLCHFSQSERYAWKIQEMGGKCKLVLYDDINHTCLNKSYPEVFENSIMEIARLVKGEFQLKEANLKVINKGLKSATEKLYPYQQIPREKLTGTWQGSKGIIAIHSDGTGTLASKKDKDVRGLTWQLQKSSFSVNIEGEMDSRRFYLRKNDQTLYELILVDNRWKSRRNDYRRQ